MAPDSTMFYKDQQDEVIRFRFREAQRGSVQRWLGHRYQFVWAHAQWPFKYQSDTISADATTPLPEQVLHVIDIFDPTGTALTYLPPREFTRIYTGSVRSGNSPSDWTVIGGDLLLGQPPSGAQTYTYTYELRVGHFDNGGSYQTGIQKRDDDYPLWPAEYHYLLVLGATSVGLKMVNDPTFGAIDEEFSAGLQVMRQELLPADRVESLQYGGTEYAGAYTPSWQ